MFFVTFCDIQFQEACFSHCLLRRSTCCACFVLTSFFFGFLVGKKEKTLVAPHMYEIAVTIFSVQCIRNLFIRWNRFYYDFRWLFLLYFSCLSLSLSLLPLRLAAIFMVWIFFCAVCRCCQEQRVLMSSVVLLYIAACLLISHNFYHSIFFYFRLKILMVWKNTQDIN